MGRFSGCNIGIPYNAPDVSLCATLALNDVRTELVVSRTGAIAQWDVLLAAGYSVLPPGTML